MKIFLFLLIFVITSYSVSFDCKKVSKIDEKLICNDIELSNLDSKMAELYHIVTKQNSDKINDIIIRQRYWLVKRSECTNVSCVKILYDEQISFLNTYRKDIKEKKSFFEEYRIYFVITYIIVSFFLLKILFKWFEEFITTIIFFLIINPIYIFFSWDTTGIKILSFYVKLNKWLGLKLDENWFQQYNFFMKGFSICITYMFIYFIFICLIIIVYAIFIPAVDKRFKTGFKDNAELMKFYFFLALFNTIFYFYQIYKYFF